MSPKSDSSPAESSAPRVATRSRLRPNRRSRSTTLGSRIGADAAWILVVAGVAMALSPLTPADAQGPRPNSTAKVGAHEAELASQYGPRVASLGQVSYGYAGQTISEPAVGMAPTPDGGGYWLVGSDGGVFAFGDALFFGSLGGSHLNRPIVGVASTPDGYGYWLVASDGGIFAFGDALFFGSTGGIHLNQPIVGMAPTLNGRGYLLVASDGGIFSYGDAPFFGSTGGIHLNRPIVGMALTPDGAGYWLVASDGGIFSFGDATFFGSTGGIRLNQAIVGMAPTPDGRGYWLVASDGGIFSFGDARVLRVESRLRKWPSHYFNTFQRDWAWVFPDQSERSDLLVWGRNVDADREQRGGGNRW